MGIIRIALLTAILALVAAGCHVNVGSHSHRSSKSATRTGKQLSEYELLGLKPDASFETEVAKALEAARDLRIPTGSAVMLLESGSSAPHKEMISALESQFRIATFTGIPSEAGFKAEDDLPFSKGIRLAAARAGAETIVCYWPKLESSTHELPTSIVSWAPVLDLVLPHETQSLRLSVRMAVIDVRSGNWSIFTSQPYEKKGIRTASGREHNDQTHVEALRTTAYGEAARELFRRYQR